MTENNSFFNMNPKICCVISITQIIFSNSLDFSNLDYVTLLNSCPSDLNLLWKTSDVSDLFKSIVQFFWSILGLQYFTGAPFAPESNRCIKWPLFSRIHQRQRLFSIKALGSCCNHVCEPYGRFQHCGFGYFCIFPVTSWQNNEIRSIFVKAVKVQKEILALKSP